MIYDVHVFLLKQRQQYSKRNNTRDKRWSAFSSVSDDGTMESTTGEVETGEIAENGK